MREKKIVRKYVNEYFHRNLKKLCVKIQFKQGQIACLSYNQLKLECNYQLNNKKLCHDQLHWFSTYEKHSRL